MWRSNRCGLYIKRWMLKLSKSLLGWNGLIFWQLFCLPRGREVERQQNRVWIWMRRKSIFKSTNRWMHFLCFVKFRCFFSRRMQQMFWLAFLAIQLYTMLFLWQSFYGRIHIKRWMFKLSQSLLDGNSFIFRLLSLLWWTSFRRRKKLYQINFYINQYW